MGPEWVIFWIGLAAAPAYLWLTTRPESLPRSLVKTAPLTAFALASWLGGGPVWLTAALIFSALGDLALSRKGRAAFLYGLASFGLGHLLFVILFRSLGGAPPWEGFAAMPWAAAAMLGAALSTEIWLAPHTGGLRWPVRAYVVLITLMGLTALTLQGPDAWMVATGAAMFMASDAILSLVLFRLPEGSAGHRRGAWALWVLYIGGVALIFAGTAGF